MLRTVASALLLAISLAGCGGEPDDPEQRLRAVIAAAEEAVEARSAKRAAAFIAPDYRDARGASKRDITGLLLGYLHRHRNIHLFTRIEAIDIDAAQGTARVSLLVAMAASPMPSLEAARSLRADLHRFALEFADGADGWLLTSAAWRRVGLDELLPPGSG